MVKIRKDQKGFRLIAFAVTLIIVLVGLAYFSKFYVTKKPAQNLQKTQNKTRVLPKQTNNQQSVYPLSKESVRKQEIYPKSVSDEKAPKTSKSKRNKIIYEPSIKSDLLLQ